jgi:hypothetical protein
MQPMFNSLMAIMANPVSANQGVRTDDSVLLIYPPNNELDFREQLLDSFVPALKARAIPCQLFDLTGFMFEGLSEQDIEELQEDEIDDYKWLLQGLSKRVETNLQSRLREIADRSPGENLIVYATVAVYPLVRFGEVLKGLRDLNSRIVLAFPGEERGGRLHFMNQPDGGNYLAVKISWP